MLFLKYLIDSTPPQNNGIQTAEPFGQQTCLLIKWTVINWLFIIQAITRITNHSIIRQFWTI